MVCPPVTSEAGARRPAIIQLEQFMEASSKPAQLYVFTCKPTKIYMYLGNMYVIYICMLPRFYKYLLHFKNLSFLTGKLLAHVM
jgi:hypothetical protein